MTPKSSSGQQTATAESNRSFSELTPTEAAITLAETVRSTLGPNGMDKMLVGSDGQVVVTNDGASIVGRLELTSPVGRLLETTLNTQRQAVTDGTTTTLLLVGELLSAAESLREDGFHPTTIIDGYAQASRHAREQLSEYAHPIDSADDETLEDVAATAVTGRWDDQSSDLFASLAVSALREVKFDRSRLSIAAYPGATYQDSQVIDGLLVDLDTSSTSIDSLDPRPIQDLTDATLVLVGSELTVETPDSVESVSITSPDEAASFRDHDREVRDGIVRRLQNAEADVVVCQKSIDSELRAALTRAGILAVERTRQDEFDTVAQATGATAVQSLDELTPSAVGRAGAVQRRQVGATDSLVISDCLNAAPASLLLRGGTAHVASEVERILDTTTSVVQAAHDDGLVCPGGGATAMAAARDLTAYAETVADREAIAISAFADSLTEIPRLLATNAGVDPIDTLTELRTRHHAGATAVGIDPSGEPREMIEAGVVEPCVVFDRSLSTALEATAMVLRVDAVVAAGSSDSESKHAHDHSCDHGSQSTGGYPWALSH